MKKNAIRVTTEFGYSICRDEFEFIGAYRRILAKHRFTNADRATAKALWRILLDDTKFEALQWPPVREGSVK